MQAPVSRLSQSTSEHAKHLKIKIIPIFLPKYSMKLVLPSASPYTMPQGLPTMELLKPAFSIPTERGALAISIL